MKKLPGDIQKLKAAVLKVRRVMEMGEVGDCVKIQQWVLQAYEEVKPAMEMNEVGDCIEIQKSFAS